MTRAPGPAPDAPGSLRREVGLPGAVFMGLGSIVGTGLFVSLGIAAGVAGSGILLALPLAALLALFNGLSSAQLAAAHPVSGGTYAYGYRFLSPAFGFAAGTLFLLAKSGSAATAALGFAGYLLLGTGMEGGPLVRTGLAAAGVLVLTALAAGGIRRSNRLNLGIVGVTLVLFALFLAAGAWRAGAWLLASGAGTGAGAGAGVGAAAGSAVTAAGGVVRRWLQGPVAAGGPGPLLHATALLFVAYTGYGRIATLGEEVRDPARTIPRAIWVTLGVVAVLYLGVAAMALATLGAEGFAWETAQTAAPLQAVARVLAVPGLGLAVTVAAVTAMLGVLMNLVLGLSRVALAMGREGDLPRAVGKVHSESGSPRVAVWLTGAVILAIVLVGDVRVAWSFSAFTVLVYYGITNLAALRLPPEARLYPKWVSVAGLGGCLFLALHVPWRMGVVGLGLLAGAFVLRRLRRGATP